MQRLSLASFYHNEFYSVGHSASVEIWLFVKLFNYALGTQKITAVGLMASLRPLQFKLGPRLLRHLNTAGRDLGGPQSLVSI